jgi:hypothetical protein
VPRLRVGEVEEAIVKAVVSMNRGVKIWSRGLGDEDSEAGVRESQI